MEHADGLALGAQRAGEGGRRLPQETIQSRERRLRLGALGEEQSQQTDDDTFGLQGHGDAGLGRCRQILQPGIDRGYEVWALEQNCPPITQQVVDEPDLPRDGATEEAFCSFAVCANAEEERMQRIRGPEKDRVCS